VPVIAKAGPDCDPCDGPLKVISREKKKKKKKATFWYTNVSLDKKLKWSVFIVFNSFSILQSNILFI
jgi:hypothetical protein